MKLRLPGVYAIHENVEKNWIRQLVCAELETEANIVRFASEGTDGFEATANTLPLPVRVLRGTPRKLPPTDEAAVLRCATASLLDDVLEASGGTWLQHPSLPATASLATNASAKAAIVSWQGAFAYVLEDLRG